VKQFGRVLDLRRVQHWPYGGLRGLAVKSVIHRFGVGGKCCSLQLWSPEDGAPWRFPAVSADSRRIAPACGSRRPIVGAI
jgi:hypothetical protein